MNLSKKTFGSFSFFSKIRNIKITNFQSGRLILCSDIVFKYSCTINVSPETTFPKGYCSVPLEIMLCRLFKAKLKFEKSC